MKVLKLLAAFSLIAISVPAAFVGSTAEAQSYRDRVTRSDVRRARAVRNIRRAQVADARHDYRRAKVARRVHRGRAIRAARRGY